MPLPVVPGSDDDGPRVAVCSPLSVVSLVLPNDRPAVLRACACLVLLALRPRDAVTYRTVVADPPWTSDLGGSWGARVDKGRPQRFYNTMAFDDIKALDVPADEQAHLYLWCLSQHVDWGYVVARAWGFEPVTLLTWCKPTLGVGRFRCNTEHVVVARKGSRHGNPFGQGGRHAQATAGTWFNWPRGAHSEKPDEFYDLVERLSPAPRLELFARRERPGWDVWGNEVDSDVEIAS